jgi:Cu+-exporting ATPase
MVGTGMGAKNGILIKGGRALEASNGIRRVVVDKTGTVTEGKLSVVGMHWSAAQNGENEELYAGDAGLEGVCADGVTGRKVVMAMVCATEAKSEHPLAKAIAVYGKDLLKDGSGDVPVATVETFESVAGAGVKATISCGGLKHRLLVGNARFVTNSEDAYMPSSLSDFEKQETALGRTIIFVSIHRSSSAFYSKEPLPVLAVSLSDVPKPSSKHAIRALQDMGIEVNMMTGDGMTTALAVAKQVGIMPQGVWANMSPKGKAAMITELMEKGDGGVAMVCGFLYVNVLN